MRYKKAKRAANKGLEAAANKNDMSIEDIRREIEITIKQAEKSDDPEVRKFWDAVPRQGETPTPEQVIAYIAVTVTANKD